MRAMVLLVWLMTPLEPGIPKSVMTAWAAMVRSLDIDIIAPQHGAIFKGKALVNRFIDWCDGFECGVDLILPKFKVPAA